MRRIWVMGSFFIATLAMSAFAAAALATESVAWEKEGQLYSYTGETYIRLENGKYIHQAAGEDLFYTGGELSYEGSGKIQFHKVELEGQLCTSAGAAKGEVDWEPLTGRLGIIDAAREEAGFEIEPSTKGGLLAKFTCGENKVEIRGAFVGPITPVNKHVTSEGHFTTTYSETKPGSQEVKKFEGGPTSVLEVSIDKGEFMQAGFTGTDTSDPSGVQEILLKE